MSVALADQFIDAHAQPEGLEQFPAFSGAVLHYEQDMDEYLSSLRSHTTVQPPEGYSLDTRVEDVDAANPHVTIALFLKMRGAPIEITETDSLFEVWVAPE